MKDHKIAHLKYYFVLIVLQLIGLYLLFVFNGSRNLQLMVVVASALFYVLWSITHHLVHHSLTFSIVLEYILFGIIGVAASVIYFR